MILKQLFLNEDTNYSCSICSKSLRHSSKLRSVVETYNGIVHNCSGSTSKIITTTNKDVVSLAWKLGDSHIFKGGMAIYPAIGGVQITVEPNSQSSIPSIPSKEAYHATGEAAKSQGDKNMTLSMEDINLVSPLTM